MITILSIGKKHEDWVLAGIERYHKRLSAPFDARWELLPHSSLDGNAARNEESTRILARLPERSLIVLLDETGAKVDSPALSRLLDSSFTSGKSVTIVIGGAFGVNEELRARSDRVISLSDMVFPHQLVRLLLVEQLYRSQEIARGGKYHHE